MKAQKNDDRTVPIYTYTYGLVGTGRTEVCRGIFGAEPISSGEIVFEGKPVAITSPAKAMELGIVYMTENRKFDELYLDKTIKANFLANRLNEFSEFGIMKDRDVDPAVDDIKFHLYDLNCKKEIKIV